ncbi:MAG: histidine--tRNA ligase [Helicobacteraceae bacterium]|jgi:histidyl-tRNA synthetase|nr:histidine--tRNA ligase [Helicobacteraceae bacterium]
MITALRGMKDIIDDAPKYQRILNTAIDCAKRYGFSLIETPILEETALFKRSVGESSDIIGKESYQFIDKGGLDVSLRPEGTAGVVRAFIEKKLDRSNATHRFFYHGAMFRYERPQKGRHRTFHQFGVESFGEKSVYEDAAIIALARDIFDSLDIAYNLEINSLGCPNCMPSYKNKLVRFLENHSTDLCDDCKRRKDTNPIRALDCKNEACQKIYQNAPLIADYFCGECKSDFETLQTILAHNGIKFAHNKKLVRGLDYYNKTAFEFVSKDIGTQSAIAGGGRYDKLVEQLGGKPTFAVGFALGVERIYDLVDSPKEGREKEGREGVYIGAIDPSAIDDVFQYATRLRKKIKTFVEYEPKKLAAHLKNADRLNAKICAVIGEDERKSGAIWIKNLESGAESKPQLNEWLKAITND